MTPGLPWLTVGVDLFDVFADQVRGAPDGLHVTVLCNVLSVKAAAQLRAGLDSGRFASVRVVVDRGAFQRRTVNATGDAVSENVADVEAHLGKSRLRGTCTHVKAIVWSGPAGGCLVTSANLNHNNRPECHERADALAPPLLAMADALFESLPPGVLIDSPLAYRGIRIALNAVEGHSGLNVWPDGIQAAADGWHLGNKIGMVDLLPLADHVGAPARVWVSTWSLQMEQIVALESLIARGVDVRLWLPSRFARRGSNAKLLGAVARIAGRVTWSPTHAKVLLIDGPEGAYLATGCANLSKLTALDLIALRRGGRELAEHGASMLSGLPVEPAPELPAPDPVILREPKPAKRAPATAARRVGLTPSMLAVADDWQPQGGLKASTEDLEIEEARLMMLADLHLFVRWAWPIINPGTVFVDNWHIQEACKQFAAFVHGTCAEITLVAQPPGTFKSTLDAQIGPVWGWLHYPHHRWGFASHTAAQSIKDSTFRRDLIAHPDFQRIFRPGQAPPLWEVVEVEGQEVEVPRRPMAWDIRKGDDGKERFVNTATGSMRATATRARVTGDHFDRLVGDDLLDGADRAKPEHAVDWTFNVFLTRRRDRSFVWLNGQRLHPQDVIGVQLARATESGTLGVAGLGGTDYLCFPHHYAPADPDRRCVSSVGVRDRRTLPGELLWPERFPPAFLAAKEKAMGPLDFAAQYEQNTRSDEVAIFRAEWWQRFDVDPGGGWLEVSIDSSNWSERERADTTAITLCRIVGGRLYRLAAWVDRYTLPQALDVVAQLALEYPMIRRWHVEDKAGGRGFIQAMKAGGTLDGRKWAISPFAINAVNPQKMGGDLLFRADAAAPAVRAGVCYVKAGSEGDAFIRDCAAFPNVWPDDAIASWVQIAIDPEVSKQLGARQGLGAMPRVKVRPR